VLEEAKNEPGAADFYYGEMAADFYYGEMEMRRLASRKPTGFAARACLLNVVAMRR
jgi:hypothetical protein